MADEKSTIAGKSALTVRVATLEDATKLAHLIEDIEAQTISSASILERMQATHNLETPILAEEQGKPIGLACLRLAPNLSTNIPYAEISELYVRTNRRGQEVEGALLAQVEKLAKQKGARQLILFTGLKNTEAQSLYRSLGYRDHSLAMRKHLSR